MDLEKANTAAMLIREREGLIAIRDCLCFAKHIKVTERYDGDSHTLFVVGEGENYGDPRDLPNCSIHLGDVKSLGDKCRLAMLNVLLESISSIEGKLKDL